MKELIEMRIEDPILPMEEAFRQLLKAHGEKLPDDKFFTFYERDVFRGCLYQRLFPESGGG